MLSQVSKVFSDAPFMPAVESSIYMKSKKERVHVRIDKSWGGFQRVAIILLAAVSPANTARFLNFRELKGWQILQNQNTDRNRYSIINQGRYFGCNIVPELTNRRAIPDHVKICAILMCWCLNCLTSVSCEHWQLRAWFRCVMTPYVRDRQMVHPITCQTFSQTIFSDCSSDGLHNIWRIRSWCAESNVNVELANISILYLLWFETRYLRFWIS